PIPLINVLRVGHGSMRVGQRLIELQSFSGGSDCFRENVTRTGGAVGHHHRVAISKAGVRRSVSGILSDGLLKIINGGTQALSTAFIPMISSEQVEPVHLGIDGTRIDQSCLLVWAYLRLYFS